MANRWKYRNNIREPVLSILFSVFRYRVLWAEKVMTGKEVLAFFTIASFIYILPFISADYAYVDDNWRLLLLAGDDWRNAGRIFIEIFVKFLTFNNATLNIFPFPLLVATLALALAMSRLTFLYFPKPDFTACLVVLPILCSPFFIGNITYQYDGPGMMLAVVAAIYAMTCTFERGTFRRLLAVLLVTATLSLYQLSISVFVGLCLIEFVWNVRSGRAANETLHVLAQRGLQLMLGGGLYYLTTFQMISNPRGGLILSDHAWPEIVIARMEYSLENISQLVTAGNLYLVLFLVLSAGAGLGVVIKTVFSLEGGWKKIVPILMLLVCVVPAMIVCVPGTMLFLVEQPQNARNYMGFSTVLVFLFILSWEFLGRTWKVLRLLLIIPVLCMFSFCYAYGQVIIAKKELETAMATFVAYDINRTKGFWGGEVLYYIGAPSTGNWLPKGYHAMSYMPTLRFILSDDNALLHPHFLTRQGINNVVDGKRAAFDAATSDGKIYVRVVDRKFYSFYVTEAGNFIVMKDITDPESYVEKPR
ncbi:glucosyltransferase domain-containing protein [Pseudomonas brassicacearum]|uniref:glucosyltransferase domain-containing protein n=1 Tax=Pseudomonas brassicacearum TaxID=930166 RepID=UPI001D7764D4|nr:glucosyltransferase domain-containing protein [Pseudomonas brassicacearum]CAH0249688.1 hypothetical protein SRABI06_03108 [Pseudomonas brassicacearum]